MSQQTILPRPADGAAVIPLAGDLDLACVETLHAQAAAALDHQPGTIRSLIFDMTAVAFIDATAVSALVKIRNCAAARGATVEVVNVSDRVLRVLNIVGVADHLGHR